MIANDIANPVPVRPNASNTRLKLDLLFWPNITRHYVSVLIAGAITRRRFAAPWTPRDQDPDTYSAKSATLDPDDRKKK